MNKMNYSQNLIDRFWSKFTPPKNDEDCWEWNQYRDKDGYGTFYFDGQSMKAHRFAWELYNGQIPFGLEVCHTCDNPPCCNPDHLVIGTHKENMTDMSFKKRCGERKGGKNGNAKLTDEDVLALLNNTLCGDWNSKDDILDNIPNLAQLAHKTSVVCRILNRTAWTKFTEALSDEELEFIKTIWANRW